VIPVTPGAVNVVVPPNGAEILTKSVDGVEPNVGRKEPTVPPVPDMTVVSGPSVGEAKRLRSSVAEVSVAPGPGACPDGIVKRND